MTAYGDLVDRLADIRQNVVFLPVRHHSPGCAAAAAQLMDLIGPGQVLIEGPSDFNHRIGELALAHRPPVAIYSWIRLEDGSRRGSFYPFCSYSPEWVVARLAVQRGIPVSFIDLPWSELAAERISAQHYTDGDLRRAHAVKTIARRMGVSGFDEIWDELIELHTDLAPQDYLQRAHRLCAELRDAEGDGDRCSLVREAFMTARIRDALARGPGPLLVVTGGFHSPALARALAGEQVPLPQSADPLEIAARGIALTPYSYRRLDALVGYEAGMPGPAFYQRVWEDRLAGGRFDGQRLILDIATRLRAQHQQLSTADLIALRNTAEGLAIFRGHPSPWRTDLLDAAHATLIKDDLPTHGRHPVQVEIDEVLRGGERGALAAHAPAPPLVFDVQRQLEEHRLIAQDVSSTVDLRFAQATDTARIQVLYRLQLARIAGFRRIDGTNFTAHADVSNPWERWSITWSPEFEASVIEASALGATLVDAAEAAIVENLVEARSGGSVGLAAAMAQLVLSARLAGLAHLTALRLADLAGAITQDAGFVSIAKAAGLLLHLYRFDQVLGTVGDPAIGSLLQVTWERALLVLERSGGAAGTADEAVAGIRTLVSVHERSDAAIGLDNALLDATLGKVRDAHHLAPMIRGAAAGARWSLGLDAESMVLASLKAFASPEALGDYLAGIFALAREAIQRRRDVLSALEGFVDQWDADEFLVSLPGMRLAFESFPPRELHHIATVIASIIAGEATATPAASPTESIAPIAPEVTAAGLKHEMAVLTMAKALGLRCGAWTPVLPIVSAPSVPSPNSVVGSPPEAHPHGEPVRSPIHPPEVRRLRWRLILGAGSSEALGGCPDARSAAQDVALEFLYRNERSLDRNRKQGGSEASALSVPDWINQVHQLFPRRTIERLERDALERYHIDEMVTNPDLLRRAQPSAHLLQAILKTKHLMNQEVLTLARDLVRRVVQELMERLATPVRQPFQGVRLRRPSSLRIARNFDARTTIRRNLAHWDAQRRSLVIRSPCFISRVRRHTERWQIIVLVDESGSMVDNVIHAAITAAILSGLPGIRTHLVLFDTSIVDVTGLAGDPVETIMKVQLGGGTDIGQAMVYAEGLIDQPRRAIVVLISDFFEGAPPGIMLASIKRLVDQGSRVLGLAALDAKAEPVYDHDMAAHMVRLGAEVGAMTPGDLAAWIAEKVG